MIFDDHHRDGSGGRLFHRAQGDEKDLRGQTGDRNLDAGAAPDTAPDPQLALHLFDPLLHSPQAEVSVGAFRGGIEAPAIVSTG